MYILALVLLALAWGLMTVHAISQVDKILPSPTRAGAYGQLVGVAGLVAAVVAIVTGGFR